MSFFRCLLFFMTMSFLFASEVTTPPEKNLPAPSAFALSDQVLVKNQTLLLQEKEIVYDVRGGALTIKDQEEKNTAHIYFTAYFVTSNPNENRPIAFCFNGGPGSSSIWLHMGFLGPKIVTLPNESSSNHLGTYKDNPLSLLSACDLVFIDPVSTGFSRAAAENTEKKFCGVEEDLHSCAEFIRLFLTKCERWNSPKFLIGESYGTSRATALARLLQLKYFIDIDSLILISLALDYQYSENFPSNELEIVSSLPTCAAIASFHHKLNPPYSHMSIPDLVSTVSSFATNEYAPALLTGSALPEASLEHIATQLSEITSLPKDLLINNHLQVSSSLFTSEFLKEKNLLIGLYDGRMTTWKTPHEYSLCGSTSFDHSILFVSSAFTSAFNDYLLSKLHWKKDDPYICLNRKTNRSWDWSIGYQQHPGHGYLSFLQDLRLCMSNNPKLTIFVAAGYYDLITPFLGQKYSVDHLFLPKERQKDVVFKGYEAGHMVYLQESARKKLFSDLSAFILQKKES